MPPKLGEILVREGVATPAAVRDALKNQVIFGGRLGTNLLEIRGVTEEALARALGRQHAVPALFGQMHLDPRATALLTPEIADRYDAIPYALADRRLALLVVDPRDLAMLDEVAFATGKQVHPIVAPEARVWALLRETYGIDRHLRGIDVDFARLQAAASTAPAGTVTSVAAAAQDLLDEGAFDALYAGTQPAPSPGRPSPPRTVGEGGVRGRPSAGAAAPVRSPRAA